MTAYVYIENKQYSSQIQYVFETVFFILGIKGKYICDPEEVSYNGEDITIVYTLNGYEALNLPDTASRLIYIKDSAGLFGADYLEPGSIPSRVCRYKPTPNAKDNDDIISIYNDGQPLFISIDESRKILKTNMDIISDIFFMLSRYEEVVGTEMIRKDKHRRFPARASLAYKNDFLHRAVVNEHIDLFASWIQGIIPGYRRSDLWGQKDFAVCLSHDVDHILKNRNLLDACKHTLAILFRHKKVIKSFEYLRSYFRTLRDHTKDPYWTFKYLTNLENKYHFKSSFYFMASEKSDSDTRYDLNDKRVCGLIRELEACGCEVGYHGSLLSYINISVMDKEKSRLDGIVHKKPYGCRQHYLKFLVPITWKCQRQSGLLYDTTLCFAEHEGFRCGICLPFKPYDILENTVVDIWEIPLLVMEGTLQSPLYRNLTPEEGLNRMISIIETVKKHHGVFTMLWHNSSFDYDWEGWGYVFEETMKYLGASSCIGLSGREMVERFKTMGELNE